MVNPRYELQLFWGPRWEDAAACARRMMVMLEHWAQAHPAFQKWNRLGHTRAEVTAPLCSTPPRLDELVRICEDGLHVRPSCSFLMPELGMSIGAWNGLTNDYRVGLRCQVGAYANMPIINDVELNFGRLSAANSDLLSWSGLCPVLRGAVDAWEPDWGIVYDVDDIIPRVWDGVSRNRPSVWSGWITYLSPAYARRVALPPDIHTEWLPDRGLLIRATDEPYDARDPGHIEVANRIQEAFAPLQR